MQRIILLVLALVAFVLFTGCGKRVVDNEQVNPEQPIVIKFSHVTAENSPKGLAAQRFAQLVRERTKGRVEVQVFANSTLFKDGEELEALRENQVQLIAPATSKIVGLAPEWQVLDIPYLFPSVEAIHRFVDGPAQAELFRSLTAQGFQPLAFWDSGFKQVTNNARPLVHPSDFEGLRFRVMINSPVLEAQFRVLGADAVPLPFSEVYSAVKARRVDGQENTFSNIVSMKLYEVQPYLTVSNHGFLGYVVLANKEFWDSLPPDIRDVLETTLAEVTEWEREQAAGIERQMMDYLEEQKHVMIHRQTAAEKREWKKALTPVYEKYKREVSAGLIEAARNVAGGGD